MFLIVYNILHGIRSVAVIFEDSGVGYSSSKPVRVLCFDLLTRPKMPFQCDAPEGGDTF